MLETAGRDAAAELRQAISEARGLAHDQLGQALADVRQSVEAVRTGMDLDFAAQRAEFEMTVNEAKALLNAVLQDAEMASPSEVAAAVRHAEERLAATSARIAQTAELVSTTAQDAMREVAALVTQARTEVNALLDDATQQFEATVTRASGRFG
jgi:hypothetical protein